MEFGPTPGRVLPDPFVETDFATEAAIAPPTDGDPAPHAFGPVAARSSAMVDVLADLKRLALELT